MPTRAGCALVCKAVPGKRPGLCHEVRDALTGPWLVSGAGAGVNLLVGPVPLLWAAALPALEARWACLGLRPRRLPSSLHISLPAFTLCVSVLAQQSLCSQDCRMHARHTPEELAW